MLAMGSAGLREAIIHENAAAAAFPVQHPVENLLMIEVLPVKRVLLRMLGLVEAEQHKIPCRAAGLGRTNGIDSAHIPEERICHAIVVGLGIAQKRREVAQRSKAETDHDRLLGDIGEFV